MVRHVRWRPNRIEFAVVNVERLGQAFEAGAEVTPEVLRERGLVRRSVPVKVLGRGELSKPLTVQAHAFSQSAAEAIRAAGGSAETLLPPGGRRRPPARGNALTNR